MHQRLLIKGGIPLQGEVTVSGAKNSVLPLLAACLMLEGDTLLTNVPQLMDVSIMLRMLTALGLRAEYTQQNQVRIRNIKKVRHIAPYDLVTSMRASFFVAGPLLAKTGYAKVPLPGGCSIGTRPVDIHLKGFEALGARVSIEHGFVDLKAPVLKGAYFRMDFPSVGATENVMMAACLGEGETVIDNAAMEPEIIDLAVFLNKAGANISGAGTARIQIQGVRQLQGISYDVIPDRIEAATLLIAGAITKGKITVKHFVPAHLGVMLDYLRQSGVSLIQDHNDMVVSCEQRPGSIDFETSPFPGFPTDMQAQMMALMTIAEGKSIIKESIFENRFMHAPELMRLGASIKLDGNIAVVTGVSHLSGTEVKMTDLRAGAALVLAGLVAQGETTIYGLHHLKRGYDGLSEKLKKLGADIQELE